MRFFYSQDVDPFFHVHSFLRLIFLSVQSQIYKIFMENGNEIRYLLMMMRFDEVISFASLKTFVKTSFFCNVLSRNFFKQGACLMTVNPPGSVICLASFRWREFNLIIQADHHEKSCFVKMGLACSTFCYFFVWSALLTNKKFHSRFFCLPKIVIKCAGNDRDLIIHKLTKWLREYSYGSRTEFSRKKDMEI